MSRTSSKITGRVEPSDLSRVMSNVQPRSDPLTQVLDSMQLRCLIPSSHELTAPWGVQFGGLKRIAPSSAEKNGPPGAHGLPSAMQGEIIAVLRGSCCLEVPNYKVKLPLAAGDVVLMARPDPFILRDNWDSPVRSIRELRQFADRQKRRGLRYGGGGVTTSLLTGPFYFEDAQDHPLLSALPPVINIRSDHSSAAMWLDHSLKFMASELDTLHPGSASIINHLAHVLIVQAVRAYAASLPEATSGNWFAALFDPELAPALGVMHGRMEEPWTVATLAEQAHLSRSVFSARFTQMIGKPPLQYLTECRMRKAQALLRKTRMGVKNIAEKTGYSNESAFSHAFHKAVGLSPGAYRKAAGLPSE